MSTQKKRGLVVEGGGMRGAHTCGALWGMYQHGITDFDVVAATSAGACTTAFFVARQFELFSEVWQNHLHDGRFINLKNVFSRRHSVMDIDYLIYEVFQKLAPLDIPALRQSPTNFFITATDCETGQPVYFNNHEHDIFLSLKASAAMPVAYKHPVVIDGRRYIDGGISDSIPIQKAIDEGCDEVYLLLTRPRGFRMSPAGLLPKFFAKKFPAVAEAIRQRATNYNRVLDKIEAGAYPAKLIMIRPQEKLPVSRLTTNRKKIVEAIQRGYRDAQAILSQQKK